MGALPPALSREVLLAFWKVHILHHAEREPVYGQWMLEELRRHGYVLSPGTLYPLLARLERHGWLRALPGPRRTLRHRRNYRLTPAGRRVLELLRAQVAELYGEVVRESPPSRRRARRG